MYDKLHPLHCTLPWYQNNCDMLLYASGLADNSVLLDNKS